MFETKIICVCVSVLMLAQSNERGRNRGRTRAKQSQITWSHNHHASRGQSWCRRWRHCHVSRLTRIQLASMTIQEKKHCDHSTHTHAHAHTCARSFECTPFFISSFSFVISPLFRFVIIFKINAKASAAERLKNYLHWFNVPNVLVGLYLALNCERAKVD